jgi:hypothetical protein
MTPVVNRMRHAGRRNSWIVSSVWRNWTALDWVVSVIHGRLAILRPASATQGQRRKIIVMSQMEIVTDICWARAQPKRGEREGGSPLARKCTAACSSPERTSGGNRQPCSHRENPTPGGHQHWDNLCQGITSSHVAHQTLRQGDSSHVPQQENPTPVAQQKPIPHRENLRGSSAALFPIERTPSQGVISIEITFCTSNITSGGCQQPCFTSKESYATGWTAACSSPREPQEVIGSPVPQWENPISLPNNSLSRRLLAKSRRLSFFMSFADDSQGIAHPGRASFQYISQLSMHVIWWVSSCKMHTCYMYPVRNN